MNTSVTGQCWNLFDSKENKYTLAIIFKVLRNITFLVPLGIDASFVLEHDHFGGHVDESSDGGIAHDARAPLLAFLEAIVASSIWNQRLGSRQDGRKP